MTRKEKLCLADYQIDRLWTDGKAIKELHKITPMPRKNTKSWFAKQVFWPVHVPPPKEINPPHYNLTKSNE